MITAMIIFKGKLMNSLGLSHSRLIDSQFPFEASGFRKAVRAVHPICLWAHSSEWAPPEAAKGVNACDFPGK